MYAKVREILIDKFYVDSMDIHPTSTIGNDLGLDSLEQVELVMELEKEYGISVPDEDLSYFSTVQEIVDYIEKLKRK